MVRKAIALQMASALSTSRPRPCGVRPSSIARASLAPDPSP
jgi:hypothetical protein